jgi:CubicO group peptidase (beta-lactamase class C family)
LRAATRLAPGGFSAEGLAPLNSTLQAYVDEGIEAGFVTLVYRHGVIAQVDTIGWQDREAKIPMKRDTIFRLASMTKPVTCAAALTLVDRGKIGLNERVDKWLPEFADARVLNAADGPLADTHPAPRPIILSDLLTHRSGIVGEMNSGPIAEASRTARRNDPSFDEWLKRLAALPLVHDPGAHFTYGTSHEVLGILIERITGQRFGDYLKTAIFDPLGMKDTAFFVPPEKRGRLAVVYSPDASGKLVRADEPVASAPPKKPNGAGGLVSTADDYLRFARMLLGQGRYRDVRILARRTVAQMATNWLTPQQRAEGFVGLRDFWAGQGFGLGVSVTDDVARLAAPYSSKGSFGWPGRTGVWWRVDPVEDMVLIYLVQNPGPANVTTRPAGSTAPGPVAARRPPAVAAFADQAYRAIEG